MSIRGPVQFTRSQIGCMTRPSKEAAVGLCRQAWGFHRSFSEARRAVVSMQSTWDSGFGVDGSVAAVKVKCKTQVVAGMCTELCKLESHRILSSLLLWRQLARHQVSAKDRAEP